MLGNSLNVTGLSDWPKRGAHERGGGGIELGFLGLLLKTQLYNQAMFEPVKLHTPS